MTIDQAPPAWHDPTVVRRPTARVAAPAIDQWPLAPVPTIVEIVTLLSSHRCGRQGRYGTNPLPSAVFSTMCRHVRITWLSNVRWRLPCVVMLLRVTPETAFVSHETTISQHGTIEVSLHESKRRRPPDRTFHQLAHDAAVGIVRYLQIWTQRRQNCVMTVNKVHGLDRRGWIRIGNRSKAERLDNEERMEVHFCGKQVAAACKERAQLFASGADRQSASHQ